jgi:histidinol-phosphate/aromatic aminotransferase/cobyric acid decarboxylase-like protein
MQAVILAAGMGKRLKDLTKDRAKCMVEINGVSLISRMLHQLDKLNLSRIVVVVGFRGDKLIEYISSLGISTDVAYVENEVYDETNNIYSLSLAKDYLLAEDTLLFESDLIFEDSVLTELLEDERGTLALVDKYEGWMDGTVIKISSEDTITEIVSGAKMDFSERDYYKTVNIYKFSKEFSEMLYVPFLEAYLHAIGTNQYYEQVLRVITILDEPVIKAKRLSGQVWYEIDNIQDIDIASSLFEPDEDKRLNAIQERFGGYWRYPKMVDFCYLVNPFFPPKKLLNEIKSNFNQLISSYPSGMKVNSLLAAKKFNVNPDHIVIGNGAAELIKPIISEFSGKIGFVFPTFEEYPNRAADDNRIVFTPRNDSFSYTASDIIDYFADKPIEALVLINPDNPSGNYIDRVGVFALIDWSEKRGIKLLIDESFVDFAREFPFTLLDNDTLVNHPNLIVVKSISKSYGVPGLRLGVLAASDSELIRRLKKDVSIWNINSLAEFYMQIEEKYKQDYKRSLDKMRRARTEFAAALNATGALRVIPSEADYFMAEVLQGKVEMSAKSLTKLLLFKYGLLIKDLSSKFDFTNKQYVRIAVRSREDNEKLVRAVKEIFE